MTPPFGAGRFRAALSLLGLQCAGCLTLQAGRSRLSGGAEGYQAEAQASLREANDGVIHLCFLAAGHAGYIQAVARFAEMVCNHTDHELAIHILTDIDAPLALPAPGRCGRWEAQRYDLRQVDPQVQQRRNQLVTQMGMSLASLLSKDKDKKAVQNYTAIVWKILVPYILPRDVERVILLDIDMLLLPRADVALLWGHFKSFGPAQIMGLALEQQPTYFGCEGNESHPHRRGHLPYPGFNGGVMLLDLSRMRSHAAFTRVIQSAAWLGTEFAAMKTGWRCFIGFLGDNDFMTLMGHAYPDWFYVLPCAWNVQACTFLNQKHNLWPPSYPEVCPDRPHILHANGDTNVSLKLRRTWMQSNYSSMPDCQDENFRGDLERAPSLRVVRASICPERFAGS